MTQYAQQAALDAILQDEARKMAALWAQIRSADKPLHDMLRDESERMTALLATMQAGDTDKKAGDDKRKKKRRQ